jgi:hypothetical protein
MALPELASVRAEEASLTEKAQVIKRAGQEIFFI